MQEVLGCVLLVLSTGIAGLISCVAWQLHAKQQTLDNAVLVCFALSHAYAAATLLVGAVLPLRIVYSSPHMVEMMHRSRYMIFDCMALPCILWMIVGQLNRSLDQPGMHMLAVLFDPNKPFRLVLLGILGVFHVGIAGLASQDCFRYPFTNDNCLGVLYWRPTRFTPKMRIPWLVVTRTLWIYAAYRCLALRSFALLVTAALLRLSFHGHMSQWRYWSWEIFAQPLSCAALCGALFMARGVSVRCPGLATLDVLRCVVVSPEGVMPLFGSAAMMRF
eukprot:gnl/TRDRNA2_/TRDRNA2_200762_c0_seq1.p1 gnl/TRDRNA2_/TRDRNA2_200762_c0~~gnl/TRDRNA2_/TRDRNA2_200762_c0_seq1.p1  ORF type:complete len:276 (-),score=29.83 gnl/TRDRNA2_/TRDRNA2_200762_c0_seq1:79-906(-)